MKTKIFAVLLSISFLLSMIACGNTDNLNDNNVKSAKKDDENPLIPFSVSEKKETYLPNNSDYNDKIFVINSVNQLADFCNAYSAALANKKDFDDEYLFGKELQENYDEEYFAENALLLVCTSHRSVSVRSSVTEVRKKTEENAVSYEVMLQYSCPEKGSALNVETIHECIVVQIKTNLNITQENTSLQVQYVYDRPAENIGQPISFVAAKSVYLYPIYSGYGDYEKKAKVIHSVEELTQYLEAINALVKDGKLPIDDTELKYGEELLQTYDSTYFSENVLWLIVQDVSGSPRVSVSDICKQTDANGEVSYAVTLEYVWNPNGAISDDVATSELFVLESAAEEDMRQDDIRVYRIIKEG